MSNEHPSPDPVRKKKRLQDLKDGDAVRHKTNHYGYMRFVRRVPKAESGKASTVVEVLHSSDESFAFALVKWFPLRSLEVV